ncbi:hypothetical protein [Reticulibacter mediterranei]|uniref:hypothetical protein n=1 Tax=Reticulibacter mediterranei TaxID=2778369 RepID=UPI001C6896BE|nr:hypothetical protein [Reticulibacter mediterranei]
MQVDIYPTFKAAVVQAAPVWLNRDATIEKIEALTTQTGCAGTALVFFFRIVFACFSSLESASSPFGSARFFPSSVRQCLVDQEFSISETGGDPTTMSDLPLCGRLWSWPMSCSGLPGTRGERARRGGSWWTPRQAVIPEQTVGRVQRAQNYQHEARGMLRMAHHR